MASPSIVSAADLNACAREIARAYYWPDAAGRGDGNLLLARRRRKRRGRAICVREVGRGRQSAVVAGPGGAFGQLLLEPVERAEPAAEVVDRVPHRRLPRHG